MEQRKNYYFSDRLSVIRFLEDLMGSEGSRKAAQIIFRILYHEEEKLKFDGEKFYIDSRYLDENFERLFKIANKIIELESKTTIK
ncbi:MAG: hypothetical protein GF317_22805 [Candidatus Lokiarchaeota archaeon]|nr:hypothetical protein [Candidatus Lokiarchaeota archaeon]